VRAWILNLDAEDELAEPATYPGPFAALERRADLEARLGGLVPEGDRVVRRSTVLDGAPEGRAWSPTPAALCALERSGARPPVAPSVQVLRGAASRRLCADLGLTLPGAAFVETMREALTVLAGAPPTGRWLVRAQLGFAGRGRRLVPAGTPNAADARFLAACIAGGGVLLEPWVERLGDFAIHGFVDRSGKITWGRPTATTVKGNGAWASSRLAAPDELSPAEASSLIAGAEAAAAALAALGYFGPFGVDSFRYRWGANVLLNPRCDVNARYCMGWAVGMGQARPDLGKN
jgi:hypothetical protein